MLSSPLLSLPSGAFRNLARRALSSSATGETSAALVQLYQYAICPFCNKSKALLDYAKVPYETIEVNPLTKAEIKWYVTVCIMI